MGIAFFPVGYIVRQALSFFFKPTPLDSNTLRFMALKRLIAFILSPLFKLKINTLLPLISQYQNYLCLRQSLYPHEVSNTVFLSSGGISPIRFNLPCLQIGQCVMSLPVSSSIRVATSFFSLLLAGGLHLNCFLII
jgi:hypothetical protein